VFLLNPATMTMSVPGRAKKIQKSDARAQGNNPRFPWQPSTTMLTHRLTGTTEAFGVLPERTTPSSSPTTVVTRARSQTQPPRESSRPTASPKGSKLLTRQITTIQTRLIALAKDKTDAVTADVSRAKPDEARTHISRASWHEHSGAASRRVVDREDLAGCAFVGGPVLAAAPGKGGQ
jgi:hypothetical protein